MSVPAALAGGPSYLDYNATTPVDPAVTAALLPQLTDSFGNPSSEHRYGSAPRAALARARADVAALLKTSGEDIVFTGSGTEADALAVHGVALASGLDRPHVITQSTEHPAVLRSCEVLRSRHGVEVTYLPVDGDGLVDPAALAAACTPRTVLVSIMAANNETGAVQPIGELARTAHEHGAVFHCDAAQAMGRLALDVGALDLDLVTVVGHKMYAPKGIAALYVRPGVSLEPVVCGGGQERGLRGGTENVAYAVALGEASRLAGNDLRTGEPDRVRTLRDRLHARLQAGLGDRLVLNGPPRSRLPNTLNVSIDGVSARELLAGLPELAASTGSACHSGHDHPSPVLTAMGLSAERSGSALRLSLGRWSTGEEVDRVAWLLTSAVLRLGRWPGGCRSPVP